MKNEGPASRASFIAICAAEILFPFFGVFISIASGSLLWNWTINRFSWLEVSLGLVFSVLGASLLAFRRTRRRERWGALAVFAMLSALGWLLTPSIDYASSAAVQSSCANNLKQLWFILSNETGALNTGPWPPLSPTPGRLMPAPESVAKGMTDNSISLVCAANGREIAEALGITEETPEDEQLRLLCDDYSYWYLGYACTGEESIAAFAAAYGERMAAGSPLDGDLDVPDGAGTDGGAVLYRLRPGLGAELGKSPEEAKALLAKIPAIIERPGHHDLDGGNVLYLDGHVAFVRYPKQWPMTKETTATLESLDALGE